MKKLYTILSLFLALATAQVNAQLNYYPGGFATTAGTYTDLGTNGSVITVPNQDDAFSTGLPIGFTFNFNGAAYDSFVFSTNGFIKLGVDTPSRHFLFTTHAQPPANGPFTSATSPTPLAKDTSMLFAFGQDLYPIGSSTEYRYFTDGFFGTRILTVQWKNVRDKLQASVDGLWDTINFQIKLHEGSNIIEYQYGKWTSTVNINVARFSAVGIVGNSMLVANQNLHLVKGSTVVWSGSVANTGYYVNNAVNYRNPTSSPAGPAPDIGRSFIFAPLAMNDASVRAVYAQGRIALPFYQPDSIRANIMNTGVNTLTGLVVTLTISGSNTYTTSTTIPIIGPGTSVNVGFAPFYPTATGPSVITVSVPADDNTTNNTRQYSYSVSNNRHGHTDTLLPHSGGNGTTIPNFWGAKYFIAGSGLVSKVRAMLAANSEALGDTVCGMVLDSNGKIIARSPSYIVQSSDLGTMMSFTMMMPASVTNQSVIVGIAGGQTVTSLNYFLGTSQTETPLRPNASFYFMTQNGATAPGGVTGAMVGQVYATPGVWTTTRLMMECEVDPIPPVDIGISASGPSAATKVPTGINIALQAVVKNFGTQARPSGLQVRYQINGGTVKGPVSTTVGIAPGDTTSVLFSGTNAMNFSSPGTYVVKIYTSLSGDGLSGNDTLVVVYTAVAPLSLPYRVADGFLSTWTTQNNTPAIWKEKTCIQSNGVSSSMVLFADNIINSPREALVISPPISLVGTTNPVLNFNVAYGANTFTGLDDTLEVWVSTNGGLNFTSLYLKSGQYSSPTLGTDTPTSTSYTPAYASDWRHESVNLSAFAGNPYILVAFRDKCESGNGIHIGNFSLTNAASIYTQPVYGTGSYASGSLSIVFSTIGNPAGEISIVRHTGTPFSSASPVFATNTTETTNNSSIFTPNNVNLNGWYAVTYSGIGTGNYASGVQYAVIYDLNGVYGIPSTDSLYLMRRSDFNGSWRPISTQVAGTTLYTGTLTGFSDFALGSVSSVNPLPVEWLGFSGKALDATANELQWSTASETNSNYFVVERSADNQQFETLGTVNASGNSRTTQRYTYTDRMNRNAPNLVYYRLRQVDRNGDFTYSRVIRISRELQRGEMQWGVSNPFNGSPSIWMDQEGIGEYRMRILDINGKQVGETTIRAESGRTRLMLNDFNGYPAGIYLLELSGMDIQSQTRKVLKLD